MQAFRLCRAAQRCDAPAGAMCSAFAAQGSAGGSTSGACAHDAPSGQGLKGFVLAAGECQAGRRERGAGPAAHAQLCPLSGLHAFWCAPGPPVTWSHGCCTDPRHSPVSNRRMCKHPGQTAVSAEGEQALAKGGCLGPHMAACCPAAVMRESEAGFAGIQQDTLSPDLA